MSKSMSPNKLQYVCRSSNVLELCVFWDAFLKYVCCFLGGPERRITKSVNVYTLSSVQRFSTIFRVRRGHTTIRLLQHSCLGVCCFLVYIQLRVTCCVFFGSFGRSFWASGMFRNDVQKSFNKVALEGEPLAEGICPWYGRYPISEACGEENIWGKLIICSLFAAYKTSDCRLQTTRPVTP